MIDRLIESHKFCDKMHQNARELISFLLDNEVEFGVICQTTEVSFEPELPTDIKHHIKPIALFVLSNYSFESSYISESGDELLFEAGFGPDNFASLVTISICDIIQIVVDDTPIFINVCAGKPKPRKEKKATKIGSKEGAERSMQMLLSRPENKRFLK